MAVMPIGAAVRWLAERDPDRPAITCEERTVTRRELEQRTNQLARTYERLGVKEGDFVTIGLPNGIDFYEAAIAAWKLGATPQPVSYRLPQRERDEIVALVQPALVVTDVIPVDDDASAEPILPDRIAPAYKAPTSGGSTGRPKVIVSGDAGTTDPEAPGAFGMVTDGVQLVPGPLYHNGPFLFSMSGLFKGAHLVVMPRFDAGRAVELIEEHAVDWMLLVPTMMLRIWRLPEDDRTKRDLSSINGILHLAAPCPVWLKEAWIDWLGPERIWELYAGTDEGPSRPLRTPHSGGAAAGPPRCPDRCVSTAPVRRLRGLSAVRHRPSATSTFHYLRTDARRSAEGWESLGDHASMDAGGASNSLTVASVLSTWWPRLTRTRANRAGPAAEPPERGVRRGRDGPSEDLGQRVHAVIEVAHGEEVTDDELRRFLADRLVSYKIPRSFDRSAGPVRDDAGKVRRSALKEQR